MVRRGHSLVARETRIKLELQLAHDQRRARRERSCDYRDAHSLERANSSAAERRKLACESFSLCWKGPESRLPRLAADCDSEARLSRAAGFWPPGVRLALPTFETGAEECQILHSICLIDSEDARAN